MKWSARGVRRETHEVITLRATFGNAHRNYSRAAGEAHEDFALSPDEALQLLQVVADALGQLGIDVVSTVEPKKGAK